MQKIQSIAFAILAGIATVGLSSSSATATVTLILDGGDQLVGAENVDVDGTLYDVMFVDGSCVALFDGCDEISDFDFQTGADALDAAQALLDQVLIDGPSGQFDSDPDATFGCSDATVCQTLIPYSLRDSGLSVDLGLTNNWADTDDVGLGFNSPAADFSGDGQTNFAYFTPVPEPSFSLLFGSGVLGVAALDRRRQRRERE